MLPTIKMRQLCPIMDSTNLVSRPDKYYWGIARADVIHVQYLDPIMNNVFPNYGLLPRRCNLQALHESF
ncbi:uncharacterized protein UV8b_01798 [Ustilaginoidea virens]|uniref:Uncharacterized protein n=1 Tax=Ustilaginoidea virens TaxID=1159556 RepID=A0A8E5MFK2_USTVR|nr:uncharacterized protein UV8b_01798 [Ustilaginoidea virens]QUC17557.1 hypothetical protein UV8b_01798 [Ustilaginoidea virens]